jgi:predicted transcriptional regulator
MKQTPKKYYSNTAKTPHNNRRKLPPKSSSTDISPKNEVKEMFMRWFKKNNIVGQIMSKQDVVQNILTKINAKQEDALGNAINELKHEGLIEVKEDGVTLVLTQKGTEYII